MTLSDRLWSDRPALHTAGAARIGFVARNLLGEDVKEARILLYGSFLATGKGHGTDKALVGRTLGMSPDDGRIADSLRIAEEKKVGIEFGEARLKEGHPNTVELKLKGVSGKKLDIIGEPSVEGGSISHRLMGLKRIFQVKIRP